MEKISESLSKHYGPIELWAEDIKNITTELASFDGVEIVSDKIKYDSLSEFIAHEREFMPKQLNISARKPYMSIEFSPMDARLYVSSDQLIGAGIFHKIDNIISSCERYPRFMYKYSWLVIMSLFPYISFFPPLNNYSNIINYLYIPFTIWFARVLYIRMRKHSAIYPFSRSRRIGFFRKNKDSMIIALSGALVGAIAGVAATKFAETVWPSKSPNEAVVSDMHQGVTNQRATGKQPDTE